MTGMDVGWECSFVHGVARILKAGNPVWWYSYGRPRIDANLDAAEAALVVSLVWARIPDRFTVRRAVFESMGPAAPSSTNSVGLSVVGIA